MLSFTAEFVVAKPIQDVWNFFNDFETFAKCIPTLKEYKITDMEAKKGEGKVGMKLGMIPVESRLVMQVTEMREPECIKAEGYSFLGETLVEQIRSGKAMEGIDKGSMGKIALHLDLRQTDDGKTKIIYQANVEAEGRLRKIYDAIMKLKSKALQTEFEEGIKKALEQIPAGVPADVTTTALVVMETLPPSNNDGAASLSQEIISPSPVLDAKSGDS